MILITRPEQDALELSKVLSERNIENHVDPCISFEWLLNYENQFNTKLFLISSKQAILALKKNKNLEKNFFTNNRFFIIGPKVAELCKNEGAKKIIKVFESFVEFSTYMNENEITDQINYMCGDIISDEAEEFIEKQTLKKIIVYNVIPAKRLKKQTIKMITENKISLILIYSKFTAIVFNQLIEACGLKNKAVKITYICISERVAKHMEILGYKLSIFSNRPDQNSIVNTLENLIHNKINNL